MKVDLQRAETWRRINEVYRQALTSLNRQLKPETHVQAYLGLPHAAWDVCLGLAQLFPHRRTVAYFSHGGPYFDAAIMALSKEGFTVKKLGRQDLTNPSEWLEPLAQELLFVLCPVDDPLTGELFDLEAFSAAFEKKRIFRVYLSHVYHRHQPSPLNPHPFEAHILSLRPDRALLVAGERARVDSLLTSGLHWPEVSVEEAQADLIEAASDRVAVEEFESKLPAGGKAFFSHFSVGAERIYDRAVIYWEDMDGYSLITELAHHLGFSLYQPGEETRLETASLCRWENPKQTEWLKDQGVSPNALRGLVVIAHSLLTPALAQAIIHAHNKVLADQNP